MKAFHTISGLPRSGSTLLCNVLNQNPAFFASTTSILPSLLATTQNFMSNSIEFKAELDKNTEAVERKAKALFTAMINAWYVDKKKQVVFDKSRAWTNNFLLMAQVMPESRCICMTRDLREVFASIEKNHRNTALFDASPDPVSKTVWAMADEMFSPKGIIGGPVTFIEDCLRRRLHDNVLFVKFEDFVSNPDFEMRKIYAYLKFDYYEHDFENVKDTSEDPDGLYLNKFPHNGDGKIEPPKSRWDEMFTPDLANQIVGRYPGYNQYFNYAQPHS